MLNMRKLAAGISVCALLCDTFQDYLDITPGTLDCTQEGPGVQNSSVCSKPIHNAGVAQLYAARCGVKRPLHSSLYYNYSSRRRA